MVGSWDDLRVFLTLAREGTLTAAARRLEVSHPTVARRVRALEAAIGARLFDRLPERYALTAAGEELLADAQAMEQSAEAIERRSAGLTDTARGTVRLAAVEATIAFVARHLPRLRRDLQCVEIELCASHMLANLSRREADLMIREQVPDEAAIVTRRLGRVAYAVYRQAGQAEPVAELAALGRLPWIGFDEEHGYMPGQAWMQELLGGARPAIRVNNWMVLHEAVLSGAGVAVLPCFMGDGDPGLRRVGQVLDAVSADQWLLVHRDLRVLPRIRAVMDALIELFREEAGAIEGVPRRGASGAASLAA